MRDRWTMNRMGFVNFWLYHVEEFTFEDGKLLLRGQNGSGKSITTQSFIPFILDGDRTPSRLDPFGSGDRRMEFYFLGEEGREESTGYLYLEFRKKGTEEYRTIGIGQRARKGKPMDFWGFVVLDGRRMGWDLWLYKEVGSSKIPLEKGELKKVLGEENPLTDVPREYKELVNKHLFGFGRAEQYEQFIKLLVKVRAPKLSKEFKPSKVYDILNDSLQTLTDEDLRPMVDAMEKMDTIQGTLDQLNRALADAKALRSEYARYNRYMLGKKGLAYQGARKATALAQAEVDRQKIEKESLLEEQRAKKEAQETLENRERMAAAELESLLDTELEEMDTKLDKARLDLEDEQTREERVKGRIALSRDNIRECDGRIRRMEGERDASLSRLEEEKEELQEIQETLQWEKHSRVLELLEEARIPASGTVTGELQRYQKEVAAGKEAVERHGQAQRQRDEMMEEAEVRRRDREEKRAARDRALREQENAREDCIRQVYRAGRESQEWKLSREVLETVEKILQEYHGSGDGRKIDQVFQRAYQQSRDGLADAMLRREKELEEQQMILEELERNRKELEAREDLEPERREAVETSRRMLEEAGIQALPFYKTVEFAENMSPQECAWLEAQLWEMGLLDALVATEEAFARICTEFPAFVDCVIRPGESKGLRTAGGMAQPGRESGGADDAACPGQDGSQGISGLVVNCEMDPAMQEATGAILGQISLEATAEGVREKSEDMSDGSAEPEGAACLSGRAYPCPGERGASAWVAPEGYYGQGILFGRTEGKTQAEYVGVLARKQKKERLLRQLSEQMQQVRAALEELERQKEQVSGRMKRLDQEYGAAPSTGALDAALEAAGKAGIALESAEENCRILDSRLESCQQELKKRYQEMLTACRPFPYGRTLEEYSAAMDAASDYLRSWQGIYALLVQISQKESEIRAQRDMIEKEEEIIDDAELDRRSAAGKIEELNLKIRQYEEYLDRPEVREKAQRREALKAQREEIGRELGTLGRRLAVLEDRLAGISDTEKKLKDALMEKIFWEERLRKYFEEELGLNLVLDRGTKDLETCAKEAQQCMREGDEGRDASTLTTALHQSYAAHNSSLAGYGTSLEECFGEAGEGTGALRKRLRVVSVWNGRKLYLEEFYQMLKDALEETALLIGQKDRELFEDILSRTISQQLTDRIAESRKWVQDMSALMKLDTSMGLYFSLEWKPRKAENDQELDTKELEKILLRDYELLNSGDIEKVAAHFRSKIRSEKIRTEETGEVINYMDLVRDALDYRKWFAFQMFYYRNNEGKKELTNSAFNKFSGGEKAMAMYVPLFAAVNAQYKKAENRDHPRMIALDEAFAGVDDKNISSMFRLVEDMDFDYIMNSQALWGCFETVPALHISELLRPLNSQVVTVIHYTWNGQERVLDEQ